MAETISSRGPQEPRPPLPFLTRPSSPEARQPGRAYATGKRKNAVARVWIKPGNGKITVNGREQDVYFARPVLRMILQQPLASPTGLDQYDMVVTVAGGGLSGQAGAVRHGLSKALTYYEPGLRGALKTPGFLTRDCRVVERKKYGKARPAAASSSRSADFASFGIYDGAPRAAVFLCAIRYWSRASSA